MTKGDKLTAARKAKDMETWKGKDWKAFNKGYAAHVLNAAQREVEKEAYKIFMEKKGWVTTRGTIAETEGHVAELSMKEGATYVDYDGLLTELKGMGIDTDALKAKYTKRRAPTLAFTFK